jgi:hypothetical protein
MHQVVVMKMIPEVCPQPEIDEREIKAAAVVRIDCVYTAQGPEQVGPSYVTPNKLNELISTVIGQTDANNCYFVVKRA